MPTMSRVSEESLAVHAAVCAVLDVDPETVVLIDRNYRDERVDIHHSSGYIERRAMDVDLLHRMLDAERTARERIDERYTATVGDLTRRDYGRVVTIEHDGVTITGPLRHVDIDTEMIEVFDLGSSTPQQVPGSSSAHVRIGEWDTPRIDPAARVRFAEPR